MKTSIEMQLKIIDKMRENVEEGLPVIKDVQYDSRGSWYDKSDVNFDFSYYSYRVKPQTITINGVEIPKPLSKEDFAKYSSNHGRVYYPQPCGALYDWGYARSYVYSSKYIFYSDKKQAIEASKLLFGIKE